MSLEKDVQKASECLKNEYRIRQSARESEIDQASCEEEINQLRQQLEESLSDWKLEWKGNKIIAVGREEGVHKFKIFSLSVPKQTNSKAKNPRLEFLCSQCPEPTPIKFIREDGSEGSGIPLVNVVSLADILSKEKIEQFLSENGSNSSDISIVTLKEGMCQFLSENGTEEFGIPVVEVDQNLLDNLQD